MHSGHRHAQVSGRQLPSSPTRHAEYAAWSAAAPPSRLCCLRLMIMSTCSFLTLTVTLNPASPCSSLRSQVPLVIHNPHALPMYREERKNTKRNRERDRQDPVKTQKPTPGSAAASGPGSGGVLGSTGGTLLTQYILKNHVRLPPHSQLCQMVVIGRQQRDTAMDLWPVAACSASAHAGCEGSVLCAGAHAQAGE